MRNQKGVSAIAIILVLLLFALGGGGFFFYKQKQSRNLPQTTTFDHINLTEEVIIFLYQSIPSLYNRVSQLNYELVLIASELDRIGELENEYPAEKRLIQSERTVWTTLQKDLRGSVQSAEKAAQSYYVAYMINKEKGKELISENLAELLSRTDEILEQSKKETSRLKTVTNQTFMEKLRALF